MKREWWVVPPMLIGKTKSIARRLIGINLSEESCRDVGRLVERVALI